MLQSPQPERGMKSEASNSLPRWLMAGIHDYLVRYPPRGSRPVPSQSGHSFLAWFWPWSWLAGWSGSVSVSGAAVGPARTLPEPPQDWHGLAGCCMAMVSSLLLVGGVDGFPDLGDGGLLGGV